MTRGHVREQHMVQRMVAYFVRLPRHFHGFRFPAHSVRQHASLLLVEIGCIFAIVFTQVSSSDSYTSFGTGVTPNFAARRSFSASKSGSVTGLSFATSTSVGATSWAYSAVQRCEYSVSCR